MWGVGEHVSNLSGLEPTALNVENGINMRCLRSLSVFHVQITMHFTGINSFNYDKSYEVGILSSTFYERGN